MSSLGLKFFTLNAYSIQFTFFFIYINLQIALAFLATGFFSNVKTATGSNREFRKCLLVICIPYGET